MTSGEMDLWLCGNVIVDAMDVRLGDRTLADGFRQSGNHADVRDGKDGNGRAQPRRSP